MVGVQPSGSYRRPAGRDFSLHYPTTTGRLFGCGWRPRYVLANKFRDMRTANLFFTFHYENDIAGQFPTIGRAYRIDRG
jgi:hypothetical protein